MGATGQAIRRRWLSRTSAIEKARSRRRIADENRLSNSNVALWRQVGDGLPGRRGRGRLFAATEKGIRRRTLVGKRLFKQCDLLCPFRANPKGRRLRGRRGDDLIRPGNPLRSGG